MSSNIDNILASIDAKVATNFPALTVTELDNIKASFFLSGLPLEDKTVYRLANSSITLIDPLEQGIAKIIEFYRALCLHGKDHEFLLTSKSLFDLVKHFTPNQLYYHERLKKECELIVPKAIKETASFDQLISSLKLWKSNFMQLQCPFIVIALLLLTMHRLIRSDDAFTNVDWTPLIITIWRREHINFDAQCNKAIQYILDNNRRTK